MLNLSWTLIFNMSTQKDVVNDVKAESALEYAAAIKPKIKIIIKMSDKNNNIIDREPSSDEDDDVDVDKLDGSFKMVDEINKNGGK